MRGRTPSAPRIETNSPYRPLLDQDNEEEASQSSSSNSPTRADFEESDFFAGNNDSQSSIGVPTFQDIAVSTEPCQPPINRLPAEILIHIFEKLNSPQDLLNCMCVNKNWARNSVQKLWHRPGCTTWAKHHAICESLSLEKPYFAYRDFIKRLNLANLSDRVNDGSVQPLSVCTQVERLTLTNCEGLTDQGLIGLVTDSKNLLALDISGDVQITEISVNVLADNCKKLQGLNVSNCVRISNEAMIKVAESCKHIKRLKLNDCNQLEDHAIMAFAKHCPNILEIDLHQCKLISNEPITSLLQFGQSLRELRLANCDLISDTAFLALPAGQAFDHLRILDLTSCTRLTDRAVEKIVAVAPRLRNLVLAKCRNITDSAVTAISKLGKNLHYVHLGHCGHITDEAIIKLVRACNRIRYIDLGCCMKLTDAAVKELARLPKLRRIGLVKCHLITDEAVFALAKNDQYQTPAGFPLIPGGMTRASSLERVHLSYCVNLSLRSIIVLLNKCHRLTHLSLTGVHAFLRNDLEIYCREAPVEFTPHQREVFCVFSGQGVVGLRKYLNSQNRDRHPSDSGDDAEAEAEDEEGDVETLNGSDTAYTPYNGPALPPDGPAFQLLDYAGNPYPTQAASDVQGQVGEGHMAHGLVGGGQMVQLAPLGSFLPGHPGYVGGTPANVEVVDDQAMTGMMHATALNGGEDDTIDEELEDDEMIGFDHPRPHGRP